MSNPPQRVAIIGGGYAGMAAAVTLAERHVPVTVYEAGATLGGRARRVEINGVTLDNGLHILIGAYRETLRLIAQVHPSPANALLPLLRLPLDWHMHDHLHLRAPKLPAPLHLVAALLTAEGANWRERWAAIRMMRSLRGANFQLAQDTTVAALLQKYAQGSALTQHLWNPLCVSALNTPPDKASAQLFLNVLRDGLNADRAGSDLLIARVDLSALFPEPAADYVRAQGGEVFTSHRVTAVDPVTGGFRVITSTDTRTFSHVICALPPHQVAAFLTGISALSESMEMVQTLAYQPITSVYLQFSGHVRLPTPMIGLADGIAHWLFDREAICGQHGLIGAVISAEGSHQDLTQEALGERVHAELAAKFGPLPPLQWQRVISEKRATFSATPGLRRPAQKTPLANFWLAGDYTS
ncbi:MAG: hydroxysqualene dehydroxylase HpnE, partial [Burkholderiales bacterium]